MDVKSYPFEECRKSGILDPTYVLQAGEFLAGPFFVLQSQPLAIKIAFLVVFMIEPVFL